MPTSCADQLQHVFAAWVSACVLHSDFPAGAAAVVLLLLLLVSGMNPTT
jgi:hypothetical protein